MGFFDKLLGKKKAKTPKRDAVDDLVNSIKEKATAAPVKSEKDIATANGEPWIQVLRVDIDPNNLHQGSFELDWNDIFVARLVKAGYMMKPTDTDAEIVDRWFQNICRNIVLETWEQEEAIRNSGSVYVRSKDIGNGRSEIS